MSLNRVIGNGNRIPWHLPEDFKWFKQTTIGHIILMGRRTYESIGRPLPDRTTIVLTRGGFSAPGIQIIHDLRELDPDRESRDIFICGGAQVYEQALPLCSDLYLTLVKREVEGDAFFPAFEDRFSAVDEIRDTPEFKITRYQNKTLQA